jgi:selenocysteine-specific elongation factor
VLPSGRRLSVVDVPGHERFVRTMVAGATGIDLFLLVVAADDGVMPQTREHAAILELLAIPAGVVAITKVDLADDELAALAAEQAAELLADGPYAGAEIVPVSARTRTGVDELRAALDRVADGARPRAGAGDVRLPIDRSFTLRGIGTVVTGTLWSGAIAAGDRLAIEPGGGEARVRSVQVHDRQVERADAGQRVAVALTGVDRARAPRGSWLATPRTLAPSYRLECELAVVASAPRELRGAERVTVHHGTAETPARVAVREAAAIPAGGRGRAQVRLERAVVARRGDRVVVRLTAPATTVAGGIVLDPTPPRTPRPEREPAPAAPAAPAQPAPHAPAVDPAGAAALLARLDDERFAPAPLADGDRAAAAALVADGRVVRAGRELVFATDAFAAARAATVELAAAGGSVTLAQLRDRLGCSRRHAQAILEALDAEGVTRRVGDARVLRRRGRDLAR